MAAALSSSTIFETNPYEGHPNLTELEAEVLWQYAQLAQNVKEVRVPTFRHYSVVATPEHNSAKSFFLSSYRPVLTSLGSSWLQKHAV